MNDEIKEILEHLKYRCAGPKELELSDCLLLLDYITNLQKEIYKQVHTSIVQKKQIKNLQEENEKLKEIIKENTILVKDENGNYQECNINPLDYKSRCEKASEKLGNYKHYSTPTEEQNSENEDVVDSALNILQNGSEKNE